MSQKSAESHGVARDGEQEENITGEAFDAAVVCRKDVSIEASVENAQKPASSEEIKPSPNASSEASAVIEQAAETTDSARDGEGQPINSDETEATTTVQFIAVSAEEHQRMVSSGELPVSVQGADIHMQIPGAESQQVRLIAVDSNGVPVTETAILQAAAEQAGIVFITKDDNNQDIQISIDEAMKLSEGGSGARHIITATTAASLLDQQPSKEPQKDDGNESEDENDGRASKPALQIRAYSQKELSQSSDDSGLPTSMLNTSTGASSTALVPMNIPEEYNATAMIPAQGMELNDESVYEFQEPPTGKDTEEENNKIAIVDASMFKKGPRRGMDKARDRRKIYQCKECAFYSHRHSNLVRHIKIHTDERPYQCHLCERAFRTNTLLRNHINTHTGVKPYKCAEPDCVMAFVTSGELTRHIRYRHTHEKPFKCTLCDYASVEISKLRRHFRSHTGERPYSCEDCGKAFADSFHLKRHRMSHTGEKPYECPECNQRFTQRGSVKMHIMQQHLKNAPKFECEICHTLLGRKSDLNVHMRKQHAYQETPIECRFCGELFHDRWSLMKHQKSHRSYGTRQSQNGREGKKRPWEIDDEDEEVVEESTGAKVPMLMESEEPNVKTVTVFVENFDEDAEAYEGEVHNVMMLQGGDPGEASVTQSTAIDDLMPSDSEPVLLIKSKPDKLIPEIDDEAQSVSLVTAESGDDRVTTVISETGEIVHLVDSKMLGQLVSANQGEDEGMEDDGKLEIADAEDDLLGIAINTN